MEIVLQPTHLAFGPGLLFGRDPCLFLRIHSCGALVLRSFPWAGHHTDNTSQSASQRQHAATSPRFAVKSVSLSLSLSLSPPPPSSPPPRKSVLL